MTGWRAYGIEMCEKCEELFTWNHYFFPALYENICICKSCLEYPKGI